MRAARRITKDFAETPNRRRLGRLAAALAGLLIAAACARGSEGRPNVLLILCDNLNTQIEPYVEYGAQTPAIRRLASRGVTFDRAYTQHSQDGPSRASLLSGRYPEATGIVRGNKQFLQDYAPDLSPLPQTMKQAGYWTASAGRVFQKPTHDYDHLAWDRVVYHPDDHLPIVAEAYRRFAADRDSNFSPAARREWQRLFETLGPQTRGERRAGYGPSGLADGAHADGKNARDVADWLREAPFGDRPFFIAFGLRKPHLPFVVPDAYFEMYEGLSFPPAAARPDEWRGRPEAAFLERYKRFGFRLGERNEELRRVYLQAYYAAVSYADAQIGVVLDALRESGIADRTVVVLTSDVGYHLGDHWMWGKDTLFESCLRVPLIVAAPECPEPGTRRDSIVGLIDLFPTILDLCETPSSGGEQGESFAELLAEASDQPDRYAYSVTRRGGHWGRSLRTPRWRYTEWDDADGIELYDHDNDPNEFDNLADRTAYSEIRARLSARLRDAQARAAGATP